MRRLLIVTCVAALSLAMIAGPVGAAPTQARNYEAIPAVCDGLGVVVIEVVNLGNWGAAKIQGTTTTLIPRSFVFVVTDLATDEVVESGEVHKRADDATDVCRIEFVEEVEDDPFLPDGSYRIELTVTVKVVGP